MKGAEEVGGMDGVGEREGGDGGAGLGGGCYEGEREEEEGERGTHFGYWILEMREIDLNGS